MKLIFLGPPGSGKGTQAKVIAQDYSIAHISMGDILRESIKNGTEVGKKAESFIKQGLLVPDEVVNEIARQAIEKNAEKGFVLDGYPRTVAQAEFIAGFVNIDRVIYIDVPLSELEGRLTGRLSCKNCGSVFHIKSKPPKSGNLCDNCSNELYVREDDKPETIRRRYTVYEKETSPLVDFYSAKTVKINGVGPLETVLASIKKSL